MSSVQKAMALFGHLQNPPYEYSLGELAEAIGYTKSGTYKILAVLQQSGYVQQNSSKAYSLGYGVIPLYTAYENSSLNWNICRPYLEHLRDVTGETCTLARWENGSAHILFRVRSPENLSLEGNIGRTLPLNASAHGKLLAAYLDENEIDTLLAKEPLRKICRNTITDVNVLKEEYTKIRNSGISISTEESSIGAVGIAAPIFRRDGHVIASLCCGTPLIRMNATKRKLIIENVRETASELSKALGGGSPQ